MDANLKKQNKPFESYDFNIFEPSPLIFNLENEKNKRNISNIFDN